MSVEYHIVARIEGKVVHVSISLNRSETVPTHHLVFQPVNGRDIFPITVYWRTPPPESESEHANATATVFALCQRLYDESAYDGPVDCCL